MKEIKLTPEELKAAIDFGKRIGEGFFGTVFTYKGKLIKLDKSLYNALRSTIPMLSSDMLRYRYRWGKEDLDNREQLEELEKRQHLIRPKVPEGIVTITDTDDRIDGVSPGIIIPHFEDYENLKQVPSNDYKRILIILRKIFDDIRSLADNEITNEDIYRSNSGSHLDYPKFHEYNILQKGNDAQIVDMSGPFVHVGKDFTSPDRMYSEFAAIINRYFRDNGLDPIYDHHNEKINEAKLAYMISEFEKQTKSK